MNFIGYKLKNNIKEFAQFSYCTINDNNPKEFQTKLDVNLLYYFIYIHQLGDEKEISKFTLFIKTILPNKFIDTLAFFLNKSDFYDDENHFLKLLLKEEQSLILSLFLNKIYDQEQIKRKLVIINVNISDILFNEKNSHKISETINFINYFFIDEKFNISNILPDLIKLDKKHQEEIFDLIGKKEYSPHSFFNAHLWIYFFSNFSYSKYKFIFEKIALILVERQFYFDEYLCKISSYFTSTNFDEVDLTKNEKLSLMVISLYFYLIKNVKEEDAKKAFVIAKVVISSAYFKKLRSSLKSEIAFSLLPIFNYFDQYQYVEKYVQINEANLILSMSDKINFHNSHHIYYNKKWKILINENDLYSYLHNLFDNLIKINQSDFHDRHVKNKKKFKIGIRQYHIDEKSIDSIILLVKKMISEKIKFINEEDLFLDLDHFQLQAYKMKNKNIRICQSKKERV